jgi:hypothetical protein
MVYLRTSLLHCPRSTPTAIMPKSCTIWSTVASPDLQLQYCAYCQSALYCSKAYQRKDWKRRHRHICKLNVEHGDRQSWTGMHTDRFIASKEQFEEGQRSLHEEGKRFLKFFQESTNDGLIRSDKKEVSWPNSLLLVLLSTFVNPKTKRGVGAFSGPPRSRSCGS